MSDTDFLIENFENTVLLPAFREVSESPKLLEEYTVEVVEKRPSDDDAAEELLETLSNTMRCKAGPSLVITGRDPQPGLSRLAGRYVMTVFYELQGDEAYASPAVMCWMRFNNKLHAFNHRYDNDVAQHRVEAVTREQILNHFLNGFDFYKLFAMSEKPFPGYG